MGKDEDKAFNMLSRNRSIHQSCIEKFKGTQIKEVGDGILTSFPLASEAVRCAIEIQKACIGQKIPLKIGIHEGEMVFSETDVWGDTVNVAARLQEIGTKGCIFISDTVYRSIKNKSDINVEFVEERNLKNINELIKVYNVSYEEVSSRSIQSVASESVSPKEKSIIVLPFENISSDPEQDYFSDGLTEEIITDLSHIHDLLVISRNSAMTFKGSGKTTKEIAEKVNVRYLLEGSVRKSGNKLRIVAQLIDALSDTHLWAEKYDGTLDDVFDIQEKVSRSITESLKLKLTSEEQAQIHERPIDDRQAYECYFKARNELWKGNKESLENTIQYLKNAIKIIGDNELLYAAIAETYFVYPHIGVEDQDYYLKKLEETVKKIEEINPESEYKFMWKGALLTKKPGAHREVLRNFKRALEINPNNPTILVFFNFWSAQSGKISWTTKYRKRLIDIDPLSPISYMNTAYCYTMDGQFYLAIDYYKKSLELESDSSQMLFHYAHSLAIVNKNEETIKIIEDQKIKFPDNTWTFLGDFLMTAIKGQKTKVKEVVNEDLRYTAEFDETYSWYMAECYSLLNMRNEAIKWLENSVKRGFINYPLLQENDPFLENIRGEEKFKKLMERVRYEWENFEI
jgi:TolB-like protein